MTALDASRSQVFLSTADKSIRCKMQDATNYMKRFIPLGINKKLLSKSTTGSEVFLSMRLREYLRFISTHRAVDAAFATCFSVFFACFLVLSSCKPSPNSNSNVEAYYSYTKKNLDRDDRYKNDVSVGHLEDFIKAVLQQTLKTGDEGGGMYKGAEEILKKSPKKNDRYYNFIPRTAALIFDVSDKLKISPSIIAGLIVQESRFSPRSCYDGGCGLMHLTSIGIKEVNETLSRAPSRHSEDASSFLDQFIGSYKTPPQDPFYQLAPKWNDFTVQLIRDPHLGIIYGSMLLKLYLSLKSNIDLDTRYRDALQQYNGHKSNKFCYPVKVSHFRQSLYAVANRQLPALFKNTNNEGCEHPQSITSSTSQVEVQETDPPNKASPQEKCSYIQIGAFSQKNGARTSLKASRAKLKKQEGPMDILNNSTLHIVTPSHDNLFRVIASSTDSLSLALVLHNLNQNRNLSIIESTHQNYAPNYCKN